MEYKDYYSILGVDKKATEDQIKQSYRRLARKYHPDVSKEKDAENKFKDLQEAYEVLKDPEKRSAYDQLGSNWKAGQDFRPPPNWDRSNFHFDFGGGGEEGFEGADFSDFFSQLFGRAAGGGGRAHQGRGGFQGFRQHQQRGQDQRAKINVSLEDAFRGGSKTIQLQVPEMDETGHVRHSVKTLKVNIPAGAQAGQQLRLAQQGAPGYGGGPQGDLFLEIEFEPHRWFSLQGKDIYLTVPVTPWEAALGAEIKIPTLGGMVGLKVAPGARSGQKLRLKGRGMPAKPTAGDQYAVIQIDTPPANTEEQKELYKKMSEIMPFNPRQNWGS